MLSNIQIRNFRCLKSVHVPLKPLTVLVGPNDSGKSAFLAALRFALGVAPEDPFDRRLGCRQQDMSVQCMSGSARARRISGVGTEWEPRREFGKPLALFQLPSSGVKMTSEGVSDTGAAPSLSDSGDMVPAFVDYMLRRDRKRFDEFEATMCSLVPGLEKIDVRTPEASTRSLDLVIEGGFEIPAGQASVGLRLMLFFVALTYHPDPPEMILLEEPENGVHPKRLDDVIKLLRDITQGKHANHKAQIILTTHSPHLLDYIDLKTDQVLVFKREDDGSRSAQPADAERLKTFLDEFMLGEVWYNEGEDGLVERKS